MDAGDALVSQLLKELVACRKRGKFAGRYEEETELVYPSWGLPEYNDEIEVLS